MKLAQTLIAIMKNQYKSHQLLNCHQYNMTTKWNYLHLPMENNDENALGARRTFIGTQKRQCFILQGYQRAI
jgi:hypothetical protein